MLEELARKRKICAIESLSRRETGVIFGQGPEAKHHQKEVINLVGAGQSSPERRLQRTMKTFYHTVTLRMITGRLDVRDPEDGADLRPNS